MRARRGPLGGREEVARLSISEPLDDPWAESGPSDRLPASRRRGDGGRGRDEQHDRGREGSEWEGAGSAFERVPPQDLDAEQSVLGGMLLSKDAIADVVEVLKGHDFYKPAHETIYQAILDVYAKGEPADPITIAAELTKRGEINKIGGPGYLHSLVQKVPTAANAEYYAEIVHERAVLRRLVEAGTRITQMGYAAAASPRWVTRPTATWTRSSTPPRPRSTPSPRPAPARTTSRSPRSWRAPS